MMPLAEIPTIDLSALHEGRYDFIASELSNKLAPTGFAYLTNHSIPLNLINEVFEQSRTFHALPIEKKLEIKQNNAFRGYLPINASKLMVSTQGSAVQPNLLESFIVAFEVDSSHPDYLTEKYLAGDNQWPCDMPHFRETLEGYTITLKELCFKLLKAFSLAFGLGVNGLDEFFNSPSHFLRLQHYPSCKNILENQYGIAPHTDYGFFTILVQDSVGGLQIKFTEQNKDEWIDIPYKEDAILINLGDIAQRWTNNLFRSIPHRVINHKEESRYSIPFFFEPSMHSLIKVFDTCLAPNHSSLYPEIKYGEYLLDRVQGNYGIGNRE